MKRSILPVAGIAVLVAMVISAWSPHAAAQIADDETAPAADLPLGLRCVVTLDPLASSGTLAPQAMLDKAGFISPNITEGTLISLNPDWVVLREGTYDSWIPRGKVLMIRISR